MIFSPSKMKEMELRDNYLEIAEIAARSYDKFNNPKFLEEANYFLGEAERLKERIRSHDYDAEDKWRYEFDERLNRKPTL